MKDRYNRKIECPECGGTAYGETYSEEVEVGSPTNTNTRGAVAPKYRTETVTFCEFECPDCEHEDKVDVRMVKVLE